MKIDLIGLGDSCALWRVVWKRRLRVTVWLQFGLRQTRRHSAVKCEEKCQAIFVTPTHTRPASVSIVNNEIYGKVTVEFEKLLAPGSWGSGIWLFDGETLDSDSSVGAFRLRRIDQTLFVDRDVLCGPLWHYYESCGCHIRRYCRSSFMRCAPIFSEASTRNKRNRQK